jgi:hypothetical protein
MVSARSASLILCLLIDVRWNFSVVRSMEHEIVFAGPILVSIP